MTAQMGAASVAERLGAMEELEPRAEGHRTLRRFLRHRLAMAGAIVLLLLCLAVVLAPLIARQGPDAVDLYAQNQPPDHLHWFGTDATGRDIFARTLYGGRVSLLVGALAVVVSLVVGTLLGGVAGFFRGAWDMAIMRVTDVVMTFPQIVIILTAAAMVGPGLRNTILIIGLLNWPIPCRLVRARLLSIREMEFVQASRALGVSSLRILVRVALPNAIDVIVVNASLGVATAILLEAGMSFLGLGVQPPTPSWGNLLNAARQLNILETYTWEWVPAAAAIIVTVLCINLIGDGLRDAFDPRSER
jgi:peptide/nickel transport system permease protein